MNRPHAAAWLALAALAAMVAWSPGAVAETKKPAAAAAPTGDRIVFSGKVYCSLVRAVPLPFHGIIEQLRVRSGQKVAQGEILVTYRLSPVSVLQLTRRLNPSEIDQILVQLARVDRAMDEAKLKVQQAQNLAGQDLAPPEGLQRARRALNLVRRQRAALISQLNSARQLAKQDRELVASLLGGRAPVGQVPDTAALVSPIAGHVIWVHPDLRPGAEMKPTNPAVVIGVMQPMVVRSQVHEIEALKLSLGDKAEVRVESLPGQVFMARISRIAWSPVTLDPRKPSYYQVELVLDNPKLALKMGLKAQVTVVPKPRVKPPPAGTAPSGG